MAIASARLVTPRCCSPHISNGAPTAFTTSTACSRSPSGIARTSSLLLARDRVGKKPLFYADVGHALVFGSEIKALLACPWVPREPVWSRIPELLTLGYLPSPDTAYEGIMQVPPASIIEYGPAGLRRSEAVLGTRHDDAVRPVARAVR